MQLDREAEAYGIQGLTGSGGGYPFSQLSRYDMQNALLAVEAGFEGQ